MNFTPEQVDLIVQRVVAQLAPQAAAALPATAARLDPAEGSSSPLAVQVSEHVITQALLSETVNGSRQVRISPQAILTPSARDFVKQQGIKIIRETASAKSSSVSRWQVIVTRSNPQITAAVESLPQLGIAFDLRLLGLPAEAAAQATSALCRGESAQIVVFTDQPELVACLANRNDRVRAAAAGSVAAVERVRISMQANLIAIDPESRNTHELKALLKAFKWS
jgi:hypothetical protein